MTLHNGKKIIQVQVGKKKYPTFLDGKSVQRFIKNSVIEHLFNENKLDLNQLAREYHNGKFSQVDYAEFNMMIGYSVAGFADLSSFQDMQIRNPLWEEKPKRKKAKK